MLIEKTKKQIEEEEKKYASRYDVLGDTKFPYFSLEAQIAEL